MRRALLALVLLAVALPALEASPAQPGTPGGKAEGGATSTAASTSCGDPAQRPWCNTALSADQRAELLLAALTHDEELSLLAGVPTDEHTGATAPVDRLGLRSAALADGPKGIQDGQATAVPIPMATAASFDPNMAALAGTVIADEAKLKGNDVILAPTVNIMRTPYGGRTFEAYGEDPYLAARTAVAWIDAAQKEGVIGEVKHFCCNNQEGKYFAIGEKEYSSSDLDERTLREIEASVKEAHVGTVMCAYNRVNGDWACAHRDLLTDILKDEWGFKGAVVSDWQAQHNTVLALRNGLDVEMPTPQDYDPTKVQLALDAGLVTQTQVDDHVHRLLRTLFAFGFFDRPGYLNDDTRVDKAGHAALAQQMEEAGIVLLKNDGRLLPLDARKLHSIALIGPQANRFESGDGTDDVDPYTYTTVLDAVRARVGPSVNVAYDDGSDTARAASVAAAADVAVVFANDSEGEYMEKACASVDCTIEGKSKSQEELIAAVAAANPKTVVVLETGDPVLTPFRNSVAALLEAWYPGEEGGPAITRVLFGDVDPGGRLPATFLDSEDQLPMYGDPTAYPGGTDVLYKEGIFVGYRWFDAQNLTPAYPFGFGLSYTTFSLSGLKIKPSAAGATVTATVKNTGKRTGYAVPQLYVGMPASTGEPPHQLKGFAKVSLKPGQSTTVTFSLDERAFSYWDPAATANGWRVAPGCYGIFVGRSSRDLPLRGTIARGVLGC